MTNPSDNVNRDERALEAFLAAAFRLNFPEEIFGEQAKKFFQQPARLSDEDRKAISSWGEDFIKQLLQGQIPVSYERQQNIEVNEELAQEYFAMNRDKNGDDLDEDVRRKIDEERERALEDEDKGKGYSNGS